MTKPSRRIFLAGVMVAAMALVSSAQTEMQREALPRFHRVNDQLYRGGQPKADGIRKLAAMGIKTIVSLRRENDHTVQEAEMARALGLRYFNVPMRDMSRPTDEQVTRALAIINAPENQPVFVHCRRGADRTGVVVACYRIAHDGWALKQATREAKQYGMSWTQFGMKDYIEDFFENQYRIYNSKRSY